MAAVQDLLRRRGAKHRVIAQGVTINRCSPRAQADHFVAALDLLDERGARTAWAVYNHRVGNALNAYHPQRWPGYGL